MYGLGVICSSPGCVGIPFEINTHMSRKRLHTIRVSSFSSFKSTVKSKIESIRDYYIKTTGKRQPFIIVAHDVWESKRKDINGLTIFFTDPRTMETYRVAVALTAITSKKAVELSATSLEGLERYGITMDDIFRTVNDNCTTAKKTSKL